ncbi:MAG: penicillin-binding protein 2 [Mariprofundaceae bacterium]
MLSQLDSRQRFDRRIIIFQVFMAILLSLLLARQLHLQWFQHEGLLLQADQNRIQVVPVLPTRGTITDRHEKGLAVNHVSYRIEMIAERVEDLDAILEPLQQQLGWSDNKLKRIHKRIRQTRKDRPVLLADKLAWEAVAPISARLHHYAGLNVIAATHRYYPYAELTSHLVGYLSLARETDLKKGYLRSEYIGRTGLERMLETTLHGKLGHQQEEVDAKGRRIAVLKHTPSQMGGNIRTSLDIELQQAAAKALGERTGAVVAMDVNSGEVLVLLSQPGFNTNRFITGLEIQQWNSWLQDPRKPLLNRTTQAAYPPASTLKIAASLAGLRHQVPLINHHTQCPGYVELADRRIRCWKRKGHKKVNLDIAITQSCDVFFYELGDQLGMQRLTDEISAWGFGKRTEIILTPESRGLIPPHKQKLANGRLRNWYRGETMITAIGQGHTTVTPLQMARFAAAIANGGKILRPQLIANSVPEVQSQVDVKAQHLLRVQKAMRNVVAQPKGTAHYVLRHAAWPFAGKTGTAQVVAMAQDDEEEKQGNKIILDKHKDHAWFMGYAPYDNPKIAIAVFVEHGGHGGSAAAPIAAAIVNTLAQQTDKAEAL